MRDNGLQAESYVAIADLDPEVADAMLVILAGAEVAAYADPCQPVTGPCLEIRVPATPCDRLYVDEGAEERARALLDEQLPRLRGEIADTEPDGSADFEIRVETVEALEGDSDGRTDGVEPDRDTSEAAAGIPEADADQSRMATFDEERAWADIVAGYDRTPDDAVPRWPALEDIGEDDAAGRDRPGANDDGSDNGSSGGARRPDSGATGDDPESGGGEDTREKPPAGAEDRFVPPPPPPLPELDTVARVGWAALLGGPVLLLLAAVASSYVPSWFTALGVVAFIAGFLTLVLRMKGGPPDDEDGAIV
jgi:hypothetical protein